MSRSVFEESADAGLAGKALAKAEISAGQGVLTTAAWPAGSSLTGDSSRTYRLDGTSVVDLEPREVRWSY
jgi:hypothetical protein